METSYVSNQQPILHWPVPVTQVMFFKEIFNVSTFILKNIELLLTIFMLAVTCTCIGENSSVLYGVLSEDSGGWLAPMWAGKLACVPQFCCGFPKHGVMLWTVRLLASFESACFQAFFELHSSRLVDSVAILQEFLRAEIFLTFRLICKLWHFVCYVSHCVCNVRRTSCMVSVLCAGVCVVFGSEFSARCCVGRLGSMVSPPMPESACV